MTSNAPSLEWQADWYASYTPTFPMNFPNRLLSVSAVTDAWSLRPRLYANTNNQAVTLCYASDVAMRDYISTAKLIMIGY
jgi:hypothetical protein